MVFCYLSKSQTSYTSNVVKSRVVIVVINIVFRAAGSSAGHSVVDKVPEGRESMVMRLDDDKLSCILGLTDPSHSKTTS